MKVNGVLFENTEYWNDINAWAEYLNIQDYKSVNQLPYEILNNRSYEYSNESVLEFEKSVTIINKWYQIIGFPFGRKEDNINIIVLIAEFIGKDESINLHVLFDEIDELKGVEGKLFLLLSKLELYHEIPYVFLKNLDVIGYFEFNMIHNILSNNSMREFNGISLSKREVSFFKTCTKWKEFRCEFDGFNTFGYIQYCKIIKETQLNDMFLQKFFFDSYLPEHINNLSGLKYWRSIYKALVAWNFDKGYYELEEIVNYLLRCNSDFDKVNLIKGQTKQSILKNARIWLKDICKDVEWVGMKMEDTTIDFNNKNYKFTQLLTGEQLRTELTPLKHSIFSYISNCIDNYSFIWIVSIKGEEKNNLIIKIEEDQIYKIVGLKNRKLNEEEKEIINIWFTTCLTNLL